MGLNVFSPQIQVLQLNGPCDVIKIEGYEAMRHLPLGMELRAVNIWLRLLLQKGK